MSLFQVISVGNYHFHVMSWRREAPRGNDDIPLVFLHGFMGSAEDWRAVIEGWRVDASVRSDGRSPCFAVDLPGHGKTEVMGADRLYRMAEVAAGIVHLLDTLGIQTCGLVGYSMGGRLALYLMLHYPDRFTRVALESATPGLRTEAERQARRKSDDQLAEMIATTDFRAFLKRWYQMPLFASLSQHPDFPAMLQRRSHNSPDKLGRSLHQMGTGQQPSLWNALKTSTTPLLIIVGEWDQKYCQIAADMGDRHPHCQVVVVPRCGHTVHIEQRALFTQSLQAFFEHG